VSRSPGTIAAAVLLPPLGVFWARGAGTEFLVSCVLTLIGFVPGMLFSLWSVLRRDPEPAAA
jgi:uncharacterized membrane protein YqaE (UPF0057 family)